MADYTICESYTLPSKGKVYRVNVDPDITIRSMTTNDEMKRLSHTDRPYKLLSEIIDDCLVKSPGISAYDMCVGDYQFLLHRLRVVTYGPDYKASLTCPFCGQTSTSFLNLDELKVIEYTDSINDLFEFDLPRSKRHIRIRMQTPRMLDDIAIRTQEAKKKYSAMTGDPAFLFNLEAIIEEVDGIKIDAVKVEDFVRSLPMMDVNYIMRKSQKLNEAIGVDINFEVDCEVCGLTYPTTFRFSSEFFGPSID